MQVKFGKLRELYIENCYAISSLFSSSVNENLASLTRIKTKNIPLLEMFCEWQYAHDLSLLNEVSIDGCPRLKYMTLGFLSTPKLNEMCIENKTFGPEELGATEDLNSLICQHITATREVHFSNFVP